MSPAPFPKLRLPASVLDEMLAQARAELPNECCGFLAGTWDQDVGQIVERLPLVNVAASSVEHRSKERDTINAARTIREHGQTVLAVYHSHPLAPALPSQADLAERQREGVAHFIISLATSPPTVRAWWLTATDYREAEWEVT